MNKKISLLKIDKGIPAPMIFGFGDRLEATLTALKPASQVKKLEDIESIEVSKKNLGVLKARMSKFLAGTFGTETNPKTGAKRVWKK